MYSLVPVDTGSLNYALAAGIGSFVISIIFIVVVFGLKIRSLHNSFLNIIIFFILSLSIPVTVMQMSKTTNNYSIAQNQVKINSIGTLKTDKNTAVVNFTTSLPISTYLEYKDYDSNLTTPVIPQKGLLKSTIHTFIINNIGQNGGEASIVIDGKRYLIDGKPLVIN